MRNVNLKEKQKKSANSSENSSGTIKLPLTLHIGHCENPKLILGPVQRFCKTVLQQ